jgi:chemotaxis protein MotA
MDIVTLIGVIVGFVAVVVGMMLKHVPLTALKNPAAFLIIIVGTIGAVIIATPGSELKNLGKIFGILFGKPKHSTPAQTIEKIIGLAEQTRREGILVLEPHIATEKDPFLVHGIQLLIDGANSEQIYTSLGEDISAMQERHAAGAQIFVQAGTYAPTLGVLGAVLGLIAALGDLGDIDVLGSAISAAFVATLLGIFTGYVLWHPMANKLKRKSRQEVLIRTIVMEGITGISEGVNPKMLRDDLNNYMPTKQRTKPTTGR